MGKFATLLMISLLLCSTLTYAARPKPSHSNEIPAETHNGNGVAVGVGIHSPNRKLEDKEHATKKKVIDPYFGCDPAVEFGC
ncbi:uncharacterized protein LOC132168199 [Corylus avellana]|uniref:uncharacterized protein LOC132168199 n=1 Tax=Corylus avellana TaxID=13451 RepID=UPI00286A97DC|nr:uncharacterized protein LOC132168199 [Corylus avellana]